MSKPLMHWDDIDIAEFGKSSLRIRHRVHETDLFSDAQLARLIETTSRHNYHVETMEPQDDGSLKRRQGETGKVSGEKALEAVRSGSIWYLLLKPEEVDPRYSALVDDIYREIADHVPGFQARSTKMSILVSSPNIQVGYHIDVPGQMLWQVRGVKKVYVYPPKPPFLQQPNLEKILMKEANEISLPYEPGFDDQAKVYDLQPGEMLHWPLNAPHRISNHDCVNVSFTTEHTTDQTRRSFVVNYANGVLRRTTGANQLSQSSGGLAYWPKLGVAGAYRLSGMEKKRSRPFAIDFQVDPSQPRGIREIERYEFTK